jgi:hypothetical protein
MVLEKGNMERFFAVEVVPECGALGLTVIITIFTL